MIYELAGSPVSYKLTIPNNAAFGGAYYTNFVTTYGGNANGLILQNLSSGAVSVSLNGSSTASNTACVFLLEGNSTLTIPVGMCVINSVDFESVTSTGDGGTTSSVTVFAGIS